MARSLTTYLNRNNVDNEQYFPATHQHQHQQQQQHTHQHLHQQTLQTQCNRHKGGGGGGEVGGGVGVGGVTVGDMVSRLENGKQPSHQHFSLHRVPSQQQSSSSSAQMRQDYQQHQHQQQQSSSLMTSANQQYQNINSPGTWLPQLINKIQNQEIDGFNHKSSNQPQHPHQQHKEPQQKEYQHQQQQEHKLQLDQQQQRSSAYNAQPQHQYQHQHQHQHQNQQEQQQQQHQQQHQQQQHHQQQHHFCIKHSDAAMSGPSSAPSLANDVLDALDSSYVAKKTFITPFDIPSPPPQPVLTDLKRFSSGQYGGNKVAATSSTTAHPPANNTVGGKSYCHCEHNVRVKNTNANIMPQTNHNNLQHQRQPSHINATTTTNTTALTASLPTQHQQHQHQQQQHQHEVQTQQQQHTSISHHHAQQQQHQTLTHQQSQHSHSHHQHPQQHPPPPHHAHHYPDESLLMPRASAMKHHQSQHTQQSLHHHQHHHQHQQYRKIDVFAAAAVDDDDNDTSPSIKLSHLDYGHNKMLPRYGKHLQNKQTAPPPPAPGPSHQHNVPRNGSVYLPYNNNNKNNNSRNMMKSSTSPALTTVSAYNIQADNPNDDVESEDCGSYVINRDDDDDQDEDDDNVIGQGNVGHYKTAQSVSRGGSLDSDLTEGRHCDLFREGQQQLQHHQYPLQYPVATSHHHQPRYGKQIRINTVNTGRMNGEEAFGKTLRTTTGHAAASVGVGVGVGVGVRGVDPQISVTRGSLSTMTTLGSSNQIEVSSSDIDAHNVARNSLHHNIYNNDSFESHLTNDYSLTASSSTYLMDATDAAQVQSFMVPLDIPTPPPQPHKPHNLGKQRQCQCENIGSQQGHFNQVNHQHQQQQQQQHQQQYHHINCLASATSATSLVKDNVKHLANGLGHHHPQQQSHQPANGLNYKLAHDQHPHQHHLHGGHHNNPQHGYGKMQSPLTGMYPSQMQHSLNTRQQRTAFQHMADKTYVKSLVYSPQKLRKVRIILGIIGGIIILALLATALYFIINGGSETTVPDDSSPNNGIHLEDILQGKLISRPFNGSWSTGQSILYKEDNVIMEINVKTKQKTRLMVDEVQQYLLYEKSADGTLLLLAKNYKKNFRHSYEAEYDIYNITSGQIQPLLLQSQARPLIMVQWGPVGNALIINFERNLYYKPTAFAAEIALTDDTNPAILNGIPDWVYEEEIFASNSAVWFNSDGSQLAFIQFDDSATHVINFPVYGEAGDLRFQYPFNRLVAYPKAGSANPRVKLFTSDLARAAAGNTDHLTEIPRPSALNTESDYIITVVDWLNNTNVLSVWMNRIQNSAHMQIFNGVRRQEIYSLESKTGWVDIFSAPFKNRDGSRIALVLPQAQDESGDYRHLCLLSTTSTSNKPEALTKGKYVVTAILHWDSGSDVIFYTANTEEHPEYLHIYAIRAAVGQTAKCLTCKLQKSNDVEQNYYAADFNAANQVIITSMGPSIPMTIIYEWSYSNNQVTLTKLLDWETNENLRNKLKGVDMPTTVIKTVSIASGFTAKVMLQLPPNMDRSGKTKYPMLVDVYGGPDSFSVVNKWILDWGTYLSSNQSVIYAKIDGRGSGLRGEKLLHSVYLKLGTVEISDQIEVAKQLQADNNYIDPDHTGIWGWSYGGYAAAMALANDDRGVFRCAASIAPVTDWAYYDSIYTERYMSLPVLNEVGYSNARLSTRALKLKGKKFLLVHGTLDDNVHYQQAMILAKNLERNDILFKQISYPDEDHALAGVRPHLYHSLDRFFGECFAQSRMVYRK